MGAVKLSTIRTRLKTAIQSIVGAGLVESPLPFQSFGRTPNSIAHKAFSVGVLSSTSADDRQRPNTSGLSNSTIGPKRRCGQRHGLGK